MNIKPLFDRVVVKPIKEKTEKIGNIILPESSKQPEISEVVALGTGKVENKDVEFEVKIGDRVIFNKYSGCEFVINNEVFTIIKEKDILAIIEKK
jgi:chaperonin GroES